MRHRYRCCRSRRGKLAQARLALHPHQLRGFHGQRGKIVAKGLGDDFLRLVQMIAGVDEIAGRLHRLRAADAFQNAGHGIGMRKNVLAGVEHFAGQQRFGKGARARQRLILAVQALCCGSKHGCRRHAVGCQSFHRRYAL